MPGVDNYKLRAVREIVELRNEVLDLATDRDIYWRVRREVIQRNARLLTMRSAFFDMMNDTYAHSTASRIRRLVDRDARTVSLRKLIKEISDYPELLDGRLTVLDLQADLAALDAACDSVKDYVDQFVAHHDRNASAMVPTHRQLNEAVDLIVAAFHRYYGLLTGADIDPVVDYSEDALAVFRIPWIAT